MNECSCGDFVQGSGVSDASSVSCTLTNCGDCCPICRPRYCPCCGRRLNRYWPQPYNPYPWPYPWMYPTYPPYYAEPYVEPYTITWGDSNTGDFPSMTVSINIPDSDISGSASSSVRA